MMHKDHIVPIVLPW